MDPLSVAGLSLGAVSAAFQLFAGCIQVFVLLSTAHNLGKDSSTLLCMLNLQEYQLTDWARRAGLLSEGHALDRRLNETIVQALLQELQSLLTDTDKLKSRYKLGLSAISPKNASVSSPVVHGILSGIISDDVRREILLKARLIQSRNHFPQRLWWAAVDKAKFEEYVAQIRFFVQELWRLLDPLRQDEMASGLQMVLSHVIGMSDKLDDLQSLHETLHRSSITPGRAVGDTGQYSSLASAAKIKAVTLIMNTGSGGRSSGVSSGTGQNDGSTDSALRDARAVDLVSHLLQDFVSIKGNPEMGIARYEGKIVFVEWKILPVHARYKIMTR